MLLHAILFLFCFFFFIYQFLIRFGKNTLAQDIGRKNYLEAMLMLTVLRYLEGAGASSLRQGDLGWRNIRMWDFKAVNWEAHGH